MAGKPVAQEITLKITGIVHRLVYAYTLLPVAVIVLSTVVTV
jgi:hypothetical protein